MKKIKKIKSFLIEILNDCINKLEEKKKIFLKKEHYYIIKTSSEIGGNLETKKNFITGMIEFKRKNKYSNIYPKNNCRGYPNFDINSACIPISNKDENKNIDIDKNFYNENFLKIKLNLTIIYLILMKMKILLMKILFLKLFLKKTLLIKIY